jgi:ABC-2 type transport system ATP-binding protein
MISPLREAGVTIAIQTQSLTKAFPITQGWRSLLPGSRASQRPAVDHVTLQVNQGELFGLVGPNGAGKTTLVKLLTTLIIPSSGAALVNGYDLNNDAAIKQSIGLVTSDERSFYWRLTGRHNLEFFAALSGLSPATARQRIAQVIEQIGLQEIIDSRFQTYSTGMRQRLSIARALLNQPRLLFLDEPTKGLDWAATQQLYNLIRERLTHQQGITILLTTHSLNDVERLCDRVAIMHRGHIQGCGTVNELRGQLGMSGRHILQVRRWSSTLQAQLGELRQLVVSPRSDQTTQVEFDTPAEETLHTVLENIQDQGGRILNITHREASLEAIFNHVTQQKDGAPTGQAAAQDLPRLTPKPAPPRQFDLWHTARVIAAFIRRDYGRDGYILFPVPF